MKTKTSKNLYKNTLLGLGLSESFVKSFFDADGFNNEVFESPYATDDGYPFPPFFIPLVKYRYDTNFYGVIQHPFHFQRRPTFVRFLLEAGYVTEVSRLEEQFLDLLTVESSITSEDAVLIDVNSKALLQNNGREDAQMKIITALESTAVLEEALCFLDSFSIDWPLFLHREKGIENYLGNFPGSLATRDLPSCDFERNFFSASNLEISLPFEASQNAQQEKWMRLQSPGQSIPQAREILKEFSVEFMIINSWISASDGETEVY